MAYMQNISEKSPQEINILDNAIDLICSQGYVNASVGNIAKRANVSKGVITYHFPQKEDIMDAIVQELYQKGAEFIIPYWNEKNSASTILEEYIRGCLL